jgi:hypothetical protein
LFLSVFYVVQQSDDFVLLVALLPADTHLPGPSDALDTLTEVTCTQQRTKLWKKLPTFKFAVLLLVMYSYIHASFSRVTSNCLSIKSHSSKRGKHCHSLECCNGVTYRYG